MTTGETGIPVRGHVLKLGTLLAADATLLPVGETAIMMIRTETAPVGLTGTTETDLFEAWIITHPHGIGMTIHEDGGTMESETRGQQQNETARGKTRIRIVTTVGRLQKTGIVVSNVPLVGTRRAQTKKIVGTIVIKTGK